MAIDIKFEHGQWHIDAHEIRWCRVHVELEQSSVLDISVIKQLIEQGSNQGCYSETTILDSRDPGHCKGGQG